MVPGQRWPIDARKSATAARFLPDPPFALDPTRAIPWHLSKSPGKDDSKQSRAEITSTCSSKGSSDGAHISALCSTQPVTALVMMKVCPKLSASDNIEKACFSIAASCATTAAEHFDPRPTSQVVHKSVSSQSKMIKV